MVKKPKKYSRFPKNISGDFYTVGFSLDGVWSGECMRCMLPEEVAPTLMAEHYENNSDTFFIRQPETDDELEQAILATQVCCVEAIRYGGRNKEIIRKVGPSLADHYPFNWLILDKIKKLFRKPHTDNAA